MPSYAVIHKKDTEIDRSFVDKYIAKKLTIPRATATPIFANTKSRSNPKM